MSDHKTQNVEDHDTATNARVLPRAESFVGWLDGSALLRLAVCFLSIENGLLLHNERAIFVGDGASRRLGRRTSKVFLVAVVANRSICDDDVGSSRGFVLHARHLNATDCRRWPCEQEHNQRKHDRRQQKISPHRVTLWHSV